MITRIIRILGTPTYDRDSSGLYDALQDFILEQIQTEVELHLEQDHNQYLG